MRVLATALLLVTVACGDPFTPKGVAGTYTLKSVNGGALPHTETDNGVTITITGVLKH